MTTPKTDHLTVLEQRLIELNQYKIDLGLERLQQVIQRLNLKHELPQIITVGGTNGKGSTVAALVALLEVQSKSYGAFTSPHIFSFNERFNINGQSATDAEILACFVEIDTAKIDINLSYFEYAFLTALLLFQQHGVDVMVLEVGLGGRLDATNALDADACIITTVDLDHTEWLGDNVEAIAAEKAGIMRANIPVIYGDLNTPKSIVAQAQKVNAHLIQYDQDYAVEINDTSFNYQFNDDSFSQLPHPEIKGDWQFLNFSSALTSLLALGQKFNQQQVIHALKTWQLQGRLQTIQSEPMVIADVAHNRQSIQKLAQYLKANPVTGQTRAVFSVLADKLPETWLNELHGVIDHWFVFELSNQRAMKWNDLSVHLANHVALFSKFDSPGQAYAMALACSNKEDRVVVFGSFHVLESILSEPITPSEN